MSFARAFIFKFGLLVVGLFAIASIVFFTDREDTVLRRLHDTGVLRVGYAAEAPYAFVDAGMKVTGESPELARLISERMGVGHIEWVQTGFDSLLADLLEGRFDVIAAGLFVTPQREQRVLFSHPTLRVTEGLLVAAGNPRRIAAYADLLTRSDIKAAALSGSVEESWLRAHAMASRRLSSVPDAAAGRAAVESGTVDALALSLPTIRWMAAQSGGRTMAVAAIEPGGGDLPVFQVAFAFAPASHGLVTAWNRALDAVIGGDAHLEAIRALGFTRQDLAIPAGEAGQ